MFFQMNGGGAEIIDTAHSRGFNKERPIRSREM
jgi:hypothetical protein